MMGFDPKSVKKMMQQMGIENKEIAAKKVLIECEGENIIITNPQVTQIVMQGQTSYQIAGTVLREASISQQDLQLVMEQTGASEKQAREALLESGGDMAQAILKLKKD
ncbi:nascent polypeptide-associated complex protein [Candidatus Parvarchaeota archaeon]|nr:nascent polypeptide-associated complex protein [Candidatus Parvarchaeota archaeon]